MELDDLFQAQRQLSEKDLVIYNSELQKKSKSVGLAYFFLIFFGGLGLHKFYLEKISEGLMYLFIGIIDIILLQIILFNADTAHPNSFLALLFIIPAIFLLFDLFTLSTQILLYEKILKIKLLKQFGVNFDGFESFELKDKSVCSDNLMIIAVKENIQKLYNLKSSIKACIICLSIFILAIISYQDETEITLISSGNNFIKILSFCIEIILIIFIFDLLDNKKIKNSVIISILSIIFFILFDSLISGTVISGYIIAGTFIFWLWFKLVDLILFKVIEYSNPLNSNAFRLILLKIFFVLQLDDYIGIYINIIIIIYVHLIFYFRDKFNTLFK
jgi:hypothetical protein